MLIVFSATEKGSVLRMRYEAFVGNEIELFGLYLSPIAFVMCVVLVSTRHVQCNPCASACACCLCLCRVLTRTTHMTKAMGKR